MDIHGRWRTLLVAAMFGVTAVGLGVWSVGAARLAWPHAGLITIAVICGDLAQQWWDTRDDRRILRAWHRACIDVGMVNPPTIRRRPDGRLNYRISAASVTLHVEVHPPRHSEQPPVKAKGKAKTTDDGEDGAEQKPAGGVVLTTLTQLARHSEQLKVMMGEHGARHVTGIDIHPGHGNQATVVITVDVPGSTRRSVLVTDPDGEVVRISVLSRRPGVGWTYNTGLEGWVVAKHATSQSADVPPWMVTSAHWELDDDELYGYDLRTTRAMPRSAPLSDPENPQVEAGAAGCLGAGEGSDLTTPLANPSGPRYDLPSPTARSVDVETSIT